MIKKLQDRIKQIYYMSSFSVNLCINLKVLINVSRYESRDVGLDYILIGIF